MIKRG